MLEWKGTLVTEAIDIAGTYELLIDFPMEGLWDIERIVKGDNCNIM